VKEKKREESKRSFTWEGGLRRGANENMFIGERRRGASKDNVAIGLTCTRGKGTTPGGTKYFTQDNRRNMEKKA